MKVVYKHPAVVDLQRTQEYIETQLGNPNAARKLVSSVLHAVSLLQENPAMGISLEAKFGIESSIRFFVVAKQLVFYEITDEDTLAVLRMLDGRQDYLSILFG